MQAVRIEAGLAASECFLLDNPVDVLLLDLDLDGQDGMALLHLAAAGSFQTIIVSANTDRALEHSNTELLICYKKARARRAPSKSFCSD